MTLIIDDSNWQKIVDETAHLEKGYEPRDYEAHPFGSLADQGVTAWSGDYIPRSDWSDMIKEREERGQLLSKLITDAGIPCKNQQQTNFCWAFATVGALEVIRAANGFAYESLSPASIACQITGYQNVGGYGTRAIQEIAKRGVVPSRLWADTAINQRLSTAAAWEAAKEFVATEWTELPPNDFGALMTASLMGNATPIGLPWWGHMILGVDPVEVERGSFGIRIRNSWYTKYVNGVLSPWGDNGFAVIREEKCVAFDQFFPRSVGRKRAA